MENLDNETIRQKFIDLETKIAYMDDFIAKLQEETFANQKTIEILREENRILAGRIQDLSENMEIPNRKPPHY